MGRSDIVSSKSLFSGLGMPCRASLRNPVFVPDHILALLSGDQDVERAIAIHIHQTHFVGGLVFVNAVLRKVAFAVVFEPGQNSRILRADGKIDIAVAIDIGGCHPMRAHIRSVNFVGRPPGGLKPDHTPPVSPAAQKIRLAVAVEVGDQNVGGAILVGGK